MLKTRLELQDTWHQKWCADKIIQLLSIISPLVLWHTSACTENVHIKVNPEKKFGITFCRNKFKSKKVKFQEAGPLKQLILLIKWFRENQRIDLETMELPKLRTILGLEIFHGLIYRIEILKLPSFLLRKKISTRKTSMKNGKILTTQNLKKIQEIFVGDRFNHYSTVITSIIS